MSFRLSIITPDRAVYDGDVDAVTVPTSDGEITVLPGHIPLISTLAPGSLIAREGKEAHVFAVARGVVEIEGSSLRVLSEIADPADDLDEKAIEQAKAKAEQLMSDKREDAESFAEATATLERELARLKTIRRHRRAGRSFSPSSDLPR